MAHYTSQLDWIDGKNQRMTRLVSEWSNINTWSHNLEGLRRFQSQLTDAFAVLGGQIHLEPVGSHQVVDSSGNVIATPLGEAISIQKRPEAPLRLFLGIHMDTVHRPDHALQRVTRVDDHTIRGPGVADAKGGLVVMLTALEAFERSPWADRIGWQILINADEEIGSPGSVNLLTRCAQRNHLGLVFEPTLPDGSLIAARSGSGNFAVVVRGRSAHVGRNPQDGRNAINAMADLIVALREVDVPVVESSGGTHPRDGFGVTLNVGHIEGGGPVNIVPDLAICRFNVRVSDHQSQQRVMEKLQRIVTDGNGSDSIEMKIHGQFGSPPKPLDGPTRGLLAAIASCGRDLGMAISWRDSGGVCDGNKLAAAGLPTVDTLGPQGGHLHTADEYLLLPSLAQRAKLTALLLMKLAAGEFPQLVDQCVATEHAAPAT